jgi:hypothetical protein
MTVDILNPTTLPAAGPLDRLRGRVHDLRVTRRVRRIEHEDRVIDAWLTQRRVMDLKYRWTHACQHSRLGDPVNSPLGGFAMGRLPMVVHVEAGGYGREYLMVRLAPGQTIDELEDSGPELASGLGCWRYGLFPATQITCGWSLSSLIRSSGLCRSRCPFRPGMSRSARMSMASTSALRSTS